MFEKFWETRACWLPYTTPDGKEMKQPLQTQLRPVNFYELIFPRGELDRVLNTMKPEIGLKGAIAQMSNLNLIAMRKIMKYSKIPEADPKKGEFFFPKLNVRTYGIGIRDDADLTFDDGHTAEGL